jgi:hypothetical protein
MRYGFIRAVGTQASRHMRCIRRFAGFVILVTLVGWSGLAFAALNGVIVDADTHVPIAEAIVTTATDVLRADTNGRFAIGEHSSTVAVRAPGYLRASVALSGNAPATIALIPFRPKAVYLSAYGIASPTLRNAALDLSRTTAINALVIDMKGDRGITPYHSAARIESGAQAHVPGAQPLVHDLPTLIAELHARHFYLIARIVVFKDDPLASAHPELAVRGPSGDAWRDREGLQWVDPFSPYVWKHNIDIAEEAAQMGVDEVQFDYTRFPDASGLHFAQANTRANRVAAISSFLMTARQRLARYNVFVAADVFGYVCWNTDDTAIGQQLEALGTPLDYISPMLYPSGFTWGLPGCTKPVEDPHQIVARSLAEAKRRTGLPGVRFRPWLQAFRDYAFDHRDFNADEIAAQVKAADEAQTDGWMLWNPRNRYDPQQLPR